MIVYQWQNVVEMMQVIPAGIGTRQALNFEVFTLFFFLALNIHVLF